MAELNVNIGNLPLKNPVMTASGTFGYGIEYADFMDISRLGGIFVKGTTIQPREGTDYPRMAETPSGMLNAVGLQNKGADYFAEHIYPEIKDIDTNMIVNVSGSSVETYVECAEKIAELDRIPAIELNISCPNVKQGGMAFVIIYLVFLAILGFPIMCAEFTVGRGSGKGAARAFEELETKGSKWHHFKWVSVVGSYVLMAFYTMVAGWMLYYAWREARGSLAGLEPDEVSGAFGTMLSQPGTMTIWMIVAVLLSFGVCVLGLQKGVEKITKVMMLLLLILIVVLAVHSLVLPNASEGVKFYMVPNLDSIKSRGLGPVIFDAMTHAFFTLSVGIGAMEIFGSYLKKDRTIGGEAVNIILIDTFVALMAGFIIIPACFAYGVAPGAGPSLLFITLPNIFNHMAGGRIWGTAFFVFMSFAALSTVIAVFENIIAFYIDLKGFSRKKVVAGNVM